MKATIQPLDGKYYGTVINVEHPHGNFSISVWCNGDFKPSKRELKYHGMKLKEWEEDQIGCDGHFESKDCYEVCKIIEDALNGFLVESDY